MIELAREVVPSPENAWQTIVNGGARQDIGQVHGHLIHAREHPPRGDHFELARPAMDVAPWVRLFAQIHIAAERPGNGYSVVINLSDQGAATAWITQSDPA